MEKVFDGCSLGQEFRVRKDIKMYSLLCILSQLGQPLVMPDPLTVNAGAYNVPDCVCRTPRDC